jgi:two-component system, LytTR family, sensor kinase
MKLFEAEADGGVGLSGQRWARLAFLWGVWALVGLFFSSQIYFYFLGTRKQVSLSHSLAWQMSAVVIFALSTPLVLHLARRYSFGRHGWRRALAVHLAAGTAISAAWATYHIFLDSYFGGGLEGLRLSSFPRLIFVHLDKELLVYWIIVVVSHAVNYYQRYREGELRASQAQLQALKMQLHPHFLFNTLNGVVGLVRDQRNKEAVGMLAGLSDLLRHTLDSAGKQEVPLREELDFLELYLDIQQMRFPDRLRVEMRVEPDTLDALVPNLILQPLVENAVRHGVAPRAAPGTVGVAVEREDGLLRVTVYDDGPGLKRGQQDAGGGGIGLSNTRARLAQLYGARHRFSVRDREGGGVEAVLAIPFRRAEGEGRG